MNRWTLALASTLLALSGGAVACGMSSADSAYADRGDGSPSQDTDAGNFGGESPAPGDPSNLAPVDNAVILVHAAKSQAFRLCFTNEPGRRPAPDSEAMPEANVVGVEVGAAVRLPPLAGAPGEVYLFDEPLIRAYYPQFGGAGEGPTCGNLLASQTLSKLAVKVATITKNLSTGVHLLVLQGCPPDGPVATFDVATCGADWTSNGGNLKLTETELTGATRAPGTLAAQIVHLSQPLAGAKGTRPLTVSFGDLLTDGAALQTVAQDPPLFGGAFPVTPVSLPYPADDLATYGAYGLRVAIGPGGGGADAGASETVLEQTLDVIQRQSQPSALPQEYYGTASNYAFLVLGDPAPKLRDGGVDGDPRRKLHVLAIPVISPEAADGGADAGDAGVP